MASSRHPAPSSWLVIPAVLPSLRGQRRSTNSQPPRLSLHRGGWSLSWPQRPTEALSGLRWPSAGNTENGDRRRALALTVGSKVPGKVQLGIEMLSDLAVS